MGDSFYNSEQLKTVYEMIEADLIAEKMKVNNFLLLTLL